MELQDELNILLDKKATLQKIRRMAFQIVEDNFDQKEIVLAGINGEGYNLAMLLQDELANICEKDIWIARITFDKKVKKQPEINIESEIDTFKNKAVVIVDDVLNTGRTIVYSLRPFLQIPLKRLQVAVLVNRAHLTFPIQANHVGYSLSTTLKEHVKVILSDKEKLGVYLF